MECTNGHDYQWKPDDCNEAGWFCVYCDHRPGEPAGFSPQLDRELIYWKVGGLLHDICDMDLIYISNGTGADLLTSAVADRCVKEGRFDQYSILLFILEEVTADHAKYWKGVSDGIVAGKDPRDRCACGTLANSWTNGKHYCSDHRPSMAEFFAETLQ
jgi:hypothetical protein